MLRLILATYLNITTINSGIEPRQIVAVIDAGTTFSQLEDKAMCKLPALSFIDDKPVYTTKELSEINPQYSQNHGVNVIGLIAKNLDSEKYCILSVKFYNSDPIYRGEPSVDAYLKGLELVTQINNLAGLNLSLDGPNLSSLELKYVKNLISRGVKVVVSAGNGRVKLSIPEVVYEGKMSDRARLNALNHYCSSWPACLKPFFMLSNVDASNLYVVGTNDGSLNTSDQFEIFKEEYANQGPEQLTGTSQAAANFTGKLFSKKEGIK